MLAKWRNIREINLLFELLQSQWNIGKLCFESDTEPYALARDKKVMVSDQSTLLSIGFLMKPEIFQSVLIVQGFRGCVRDRCVLAGEPHPI